jgi:uncharacterized protein (TIGR03435 family)
VKPSTSGFDGVRGGCRGIDTIVEKGELSPPPLGRCVITDGRLSHLIAAAYNVQAIDHIHGAPLWAISGTERFDIHAKSADPKATEAQLLQMLQRLLEDRFQLKYRWDTKEVSGGALVVGKDKVKLKPAGDGPEDLNFGSVGKPGLGGPVHIVAKKQTIADLARVLTRFMPDPIDDDTGLTGAYDFELNFDETNGPTLSTALKDQLGLRLEPKKIRISYFLFLSAEHPSAN